MCWRGDRYDKRWLEFNSIQAFSWHDYVERPSDYESMKNDNNYLLKENAELKLEIQKLKKDER
jgi:cell division protein FtsB